MGVDLKDPNLTSGSKRIAERKRLSSTILQQAPQDVQQFLESINETRIPREVLDPALQRVREYNYNLAQSKKEGRKKGRKEGIEIGVVMTVVEDLRYQEKTLNQVNNSKRYSAETKKAVLWIYNNGGRP